MGTLKKATYSIPLPVGSKVRGDVVTWTARGQTKVGKLSKATGRVSVQSETWTARFVDESGKTKYVSTRCKDKAAANRVLVKLENEVAQMGTSETALTRLF